MKLLFKIVLKACLPLVAMVGIVSYMLYMNGGDPLAMGKHMIAKISPPSARQIAGSARTGASNTLSSITNGVKSATGQGSAVGKPQVYKWLDASGVTQYGSHPPEGARDIQPMKIKSSPAPSEPTPSAAHAGGLTGTGKGQSIPGMPGVNLPGGVKLPPGVDYNRIFGQIKEPQ